MVKKKEGKKGSKKDWGAEKKKKKKKLVIQGITSTDNYWGDHNLFAHYESNKENEP